MLSFGRFPGVWILYADVSEYSVRSIFIGREVSMKMEQTGCSETSEYKIQTPENYTKESIRHSGQGERLKSRRREVFKTESVRNGAWKQQQKLEEYEKMERRGKKELKRKRKARKNGEDNKKAVQIYQQNQNRTNFICRRFGIFCPFHLHRQGGVYEDGTDRMFRNVGV